MAIFTPADKPTKVTVQSGDTLWSIATALLQKQNPDKTPTKKQIQNKINEIAKLNKIKNTNLIKAGQVFKLSSSSTDKTSGNKSNAPVITSMGIQSGTDRTVFATWTWDKHDETDHYEYEWYYDAGDSIEWYHGGGPTSCNKLLHVTFTPEEKAKRVKFMVKPIAKTEKKEG